MMFFWGKSKKEPPSNYDGKIEIFSRQCFFSTISQHKKRFPFFSHELCYKNLIHTVDLSLANLTFFYDAARGPLEKHFLKNEKRFPIVEIKEGNEALSFLRLLDYVTSLDLHPETILYFVEDDYLHRPGWTKVLKEAFSIDGIDYATLYDHRDKYSALYKTSSFKLFTTQSTHWRETPSTTHTFACRLKTLTQDLRFHRRFSLAREVSDDHKKFSYLKKRGSLLISSLPGWSTHAEPELSSPCIDWEQFKS